MRTVVVVILLLALQIPGQAQNGPQNGIVEFYTTQSAGSGPLVIYSDDQKLGEVTSLQLVRFSGAPGTYRFGLRPDAVPLDQVSVSLRSGQHIYLRVTPRGFYLGNAFEAVRQLPTRPIADSATTLGANARNTESRSPSLPAVETARPPANVDGSASTQNATIFFYRDRLGSNQQVTVYSLFVWGSRPVATLAKGEYLAMSVSPGTSAFSWVVAPARGQTVKLDVASGQQIFLRVEPSGITPIDDQTARKSLQDLQAIYDGRVFDRAHLIDAPVRPRPDAQPERAIASVPERASAPVVDEPAVLQPVSPPAKTREIKIHGYVTAVTSAATFEIDDYRIIRDEAIAMQFENAGSDTQFPVETIRVGTELDIKGDVDEKTKVVWAKTIKVDLEQFRKLKNTVVLANPPSGLARSGNGWSGTFFADGQRIRISPETIVSLKLSPEEAENETKTGADVRPVASLQEIRAGMLMTYEGVRDAKSGVILADSLEFARNNFEKGEQNLWNRSKVRFKSGDSVYAKPGESSAPGELTVPELGKFKLVPNDEVQEYVSKVGRSLIPKYALSIPLTDPSRYRFLFYVVINDEPKAFALPDGVFVIHSGMFSILENEAQLAAVMGHELAHVLQEHQWRAIAGRTTLKTGLGVTVSEAFGRRTLRGIESLTEAAIRNGYAPDQENQADRLALEYMKNAGYDPREAPRAWAALAKAPGFKGKNSFYTTNENRTTRRSYLLNQIRDNYSGLNFADFRIEETTFKRMTILAHEAVSGKGQALLQGRR